MLLFPVFPTINALAITAAITAAKKAGFAYSEKPSWPEALFLRLSTRFGSARKDALSMA